MGMPASAQIASPPRRISRMTGGGSILIGTASSASARIGVPPIAYTSDSALAAAMRPKSNGIDDRHEKIGGRDQRLVLVELIDRGIVGGLHTHQELRERRRGSRTFQQISEQAWCDLAAAATAVGQGGEARCGSGGHHAENGGRQQES